MRGTSRSYRQEYPPLSAIRNRSWSAVSGLRRERAAARVEPHGLWPGGTGIDRATISKLETGKIVNPTVGTLRAYASALGGTLTWTLSS